MCDSAPLKEIEYHIDNFGSIIAAYPREKHLKGFINDVRKSRVVGNERLLH